MAKGVFITKVDPSYDDLPEVRYHFPKTYLKQASECIGDWILYYEPRRGGGRLAYFATARVNTIEPDLTKPNHYYARVSEYMEFPNPVPFRVEGEFLESRLQRPDSGVSKGMFGRAVHHLKDSEYFKILTMGMAQMVGSLPSQDSLLIAEPEAEYSRRRVQTMVNRAVRDEAFQRVVRDAYDATCAFTGLKIVNGGGRCEIEAAHIRAVEKSGPDSPRNGIALSRTVHWMFDRGILSMEDDGKILLAKNKVPEPALRMLQPDGFARLPDNRLLRPHSQFLKYHRENVFKG